MIKAIVCVQCALTASCFSTAFVLNGVRNNVGLSSSVTGRCNTRAMMTMHSNHRLGPKNDHQRRYVSVASVDTSPSDAAKIVVSPLLSLVSFMKVLWDFTRPHTIVGSGISVLALYLFGCPPLLWGTPKFISSLSACMLPALLMNVYITGLNQITDVEIDKINKPYLPIAAGALSKQHGIIIVIMSLISSLFLVRSAAWPLQSVVVGSGILGTLYSLPPFRLKRFPALAAFCILVVRGSLVNMGFFLQAKSQMLSDALPSLGAACRLYPESLLLTGFFAIFGVVIALMKDVPDVQGDKMFKISSFSVKLGATKMFRMSWQLLVVLLLSTSAGTLGTLIVPALRVLTPVATRAVVTCRVALAACLSLLAVDVTARAQTVDTAQPDRIFSYYMYIWNIFYACYFLLPLVR